ncbi:imidazolonepropionase [Aspergillus pseudocaelatus]|uniref:Imidazolonepropionase n=1 Tax=Aspergillus pseudocaelatus TaxID=1825620 RepID=A0ABQ6WMD2_9EURO|nr:imidazolonepropionase [Aspergillus pseudocaelatus]
MASSNLIPKPWVPRDQPPDITLININVIDVEAGRVIPNCSVHVQNGVITRIMPASSLSRSSEAPFSTGPRTKTKFINMRNQYLCPGLIDCHVHLTATPGGTSLKDIFAASPNTIAYRTAYVARNMLLRGFTTARDTGGADAALRDAIAEGLLSGPRLIIAGKALSQTGGHGDLRAPYQGDEHKCCGGHSPALARICNGVPACLEAVRDELRQGANFIKIMCGGGVATPTDALDMLQFTADEIQAITTTAAYSKTYVTAHAYTAQAIRHAVDNGVRGIEHGNFIDAETARYCKEKGVVFTPTLITYQGMAEPPFDNFLDEASQAKNREVLASGLKALEILRDAGITMCYGSDLLAGLHTLQNREFSIRAAVLSSLEILQSATINAAKLVGMEGKLGCIKEGAIADFLILNANPLENITVLDHVEESLVAIAKEGRIVASKVAELSVDPLYDPYRLPST